MGWLTKVSNKVNPGILLIVFAALALIWANLPNFEQYYFDFLEFEIDLHFFDLGFGAVVMNVEEFIKDFVLTIFFFEVGLELKHEFTEGSLRKPKQAALPILGALGGMLFPALIYSATVLISNNSQYLSGFAIPTATDIAFCIGILALLAPNINPELRIFLLTLAVADDLGGILIIAFAYSQGINFLAILLALLFTTIFFFVVHFYHQISIFVAIILSLIIWYFFLKSGIHPALSGVVMGLCISHKKNKNHIEPINRLTEIFHPINNLFVLPIFAFSQLGISLFDLEVNKYSIFIIIGVALGLAIGKPLGILLFIHFSTKLKIAKMPKDVSTIDYLGISALAGIGFTVAFLVANLAFRTGTASDNVLLGKLGVLIGSILAIVIAALLFQYEKHSSKKDEIFTTEPVSSKESN